MLYKTKSVKSGEHGGMYSTFNEELEPCPPEIKHYIAPDSIVLFLNETKISKYGHCFYKVLHIDRIIWIVKDILEPIYAL